MPLAALHQQFEQVLTREGEAVAQLGALLEEENATLARRDAGELETLVAGKEKLLQQLAALAAEREAILQQAGFSKDQDGFLGFIDSDTSGHLRELWESVAQALEKCQHQNQINGQLLDMSKQQAEEILALLLGKSQGSTNTLYDQSGNTSTSYGQNTSIKV